MKLLLDECVVQEFRHLIIGHDVYTVGYRGWAGVKNGALLALAAGDGFEALVTTDRGFRHQQNLATLPIAVITLMAASNDMGDLATLVPDLLNALRTLTPRAVTIVGSGP